MKKFWYLLMVAVLSVGFVACDSDDAERPEEPVIVDDEVAPKDVENLVAEPGFEKITLKWTNPDDENAKKIRIFYGTGESSKKHITTEGLVEEFELNTEEHLFTSEEYAIDVMVVNDKKESFGKSVKAAYYTLTGMEYPEFALVQHIDGTWAVRATKISGLVNVTSSIRWIICDSEGAELGVTGEAQMPDFEQSVADKSCTFVAHNWLLTDVEEGVLEIGKKYIVKMDLEVYPATGGRKVDTEYVYDGSICNEFVPVAWEQEVEAKQATHYDLRESISIDEGLETIVSGKAGKRVINGMYQGMKLKWTNPSGTASNRILYGESEETAEAIDLEMVGSYVFEPGTLSEYAPVYYVQIQALDEDGAVIGIGEHDVHIFTLENIEQEFLPRFSIALQTEGEHVGKWGVTYDQLSGPRNYGIGITWNAYDADGNAVFAEDIVDMVSEDDLKKWSSETQTAGFTTKTMYFDTDVFGFESEYTFRYTGHYFVTTNKSSKNDDGSWTYTMNTAKTLYKYDRLMWEQYDIEGESEPVVTEEQPVNLFVSAEVDNTMFQAAKVTWSQNDEAQGYEIYVNGNLKATVDASQTEALVENVTEGVKCQFEVRAVGTAATGISNEVELISMANWTEPEFKIELIDGKEEQRVVVGNLVNTNYAYAGGKIVFKRDGEEIAYTLTNNTGDGTLNSWIGYKRWALNAMDNRTDWKWNEETGEVKEHYIEPGQYTIEWEIDYVVNRNGQWATSKDGNFIPQEMKEGATHVFIPGGAEDVYFKDNVVGRIKKTGSFEMYIKGADMIVTARPSNYQSVIVDWTEMEGANSYKVLVDGVEAETTMDVTAEIFNLTDKRKYTFEVVAYDALEQEIGRAKAPQTEIWTLTGVREPKFDFKQNVLSVSDALDLGGTAVDMKVEFYNESGELAHTAFYSKEIDAYNLPGNIDNYDLKDGSGRGGRFTKNYWATFILKDATRNKWDWDGVENCDTPEFEPGEYTLKWTANYYTIANGYWSTGADNQDPSQFTEQTGNRVQFATRDVLTTPIERTGETKLGLGFDATATPQGVYTGATVSWSHMKAATKYEIYANGQYVGDAPAGQTSKIIEGLSAEGNPYTFKVMAVGTAFSAETEPIHIYNVEHFWKEPTFAWNGKRMIVHNLTGVNAEGQGYAYGGDIDNNSPAAKSFIEIYDEAGTTLLYTLRNGTGQGNLKSWAGYGRWALDTQEDRKDWVWVNHATGEETKEVDIASAWMPAGKYTIKWTIGYVLCKNAYYAKDQVEIDRAEATQLWFGPKDTNPSPNVCYTDDTHSAVMIVAKSGETAYEVVAPESLDLVVKVDGLYQGAKLSWNKILGATNYEVLVDGEKVADTAEPSYVVENLTDKQFYSFTVKCAGMDDSTVENVEVFTLCNWQEPDLQFNQLENGNYDVKAVGLVDKNYAYAGGATITLSKDGEVVYKLVNNTGDGTLIAWAGFKRWALNAMENRHEWKWTVNGVEESGEVKEHFIAPGEYEVAWQWDYVVNKNGKWMTAENGEVRENKDADVTIVRFDGGVADVLTKDGAPVRFQKSGTKTLTVAANVILNPQANVAGLYQGMKLTWNPSDAVASYAIGYGATAVEETIEIGEPVTEYTIEGLNKYNKYYVKLTAFDAEGAEIKSEELKDVEVFTLVNWQEPELQFNLQEDGTYQVVAAGLVDLNYAYTGAATITFTKDGAEVYKLTNHTQDVTLTAWANGGRWQLAAMDNRKDWKWTVNGVEEEKEVNHHAIEPGTYDIAWEWSYSVNKNGQWATHNGNFVPQENKEGATYVYFSGKSADVLFGTDGVPQRFAKSGTQTLTIEEPVTGPQKVTVAEFLAAAEDDTMYELTGVITRMYKNTSDDTLWGNFYLKDATAEVLIYGLYSPEGEKQYWAASGAKVGDTITVQTPRTSHYGTPQGKNALFVSLVPFVAQKSEWGLVGDLNSWNAPDVPMMTTWKSDKLFVAENVNIASGAFKIRANEEWNDAKNYGLEVAGKIYADKYYTVWSDGGSSNITPMAYGTYDVWFDLENKRVAVMTPGKDYSAAVDGGEPVVVIEDLKNHDWGLMGAFPGNNWETEIPMTIEGDWAVAKNVSFTKNGEFKLRADGKWELQYSPECDVNVGTVYDAKRGGNNAKFVGEDGAYNVYFSVLDAKFYMEKYVEAPAEASSVKFSYSDIVAQNSNLTQNSYGSQDVNTESTWITWTSGDFTFKGAKVCTPQAGDNSGYLQTQGNDSTKAKQGFIINDTAFGKITKIVVKSFNVKYVPNFNLYVGTEKNPAGTAIPAGDYSDAGVATGAGKLYTTTFELDGNYTYFKIYNNTTGALYLDSVEVFYE